MDTELEQRDPPADLRAIGRRVLAVVPAFDEADDVAAVVRSARPHVAEVLVVDDGSRDATADAARNAGATVVSHAKNLGKAAALRTGFAHAREHGFDTVVTLDGDGQHDPAEIPTLLAALPEEGGVVSGNRMADPAGMPFARRATNRLTSFLAGAIAGRPIPDSQCGFRAIDVRVLEAIRPRSERYAGDAEIVLLAALSGFRVTSVPIRCIYAGEASNVRAISGTWRLIGLALRATAIRLAGRRKR